MKFWTLPAFGIDSLAQQDAPTPSPGSGQVVLEVHACSLNYRDLMVVRGTYNLKLRVPQIPLSDGAGVVHSVGEGVTAWKPGDRVAAIFMQRWLEGPPSAEKFRGALGGAADGMAAEYVLLDQAGLVRSPDYLSFTEAAALPCAAVTAWNALHSSGLVTGGSTVLIQGTGGDNIFALQLAKSMGARVLGTSSSDAKLARARALGLDEGVNYKTTPDWAEWAQAHTGGAGVDLVVEVGGAGTFTQSLKAARVGGAIAQIGVLTGGSEPVAVPLILRRHLRIQGIFVGSRADFLALNRALEVSRIQPIVDHEFAFDQLPEAFRTMESASHFGKLVVRVR